MKNDAASIVYLPEKSNTILHTNRLQRKIVDKFVASINNTEYNTSIEYTDKTKTTVREFSFGFSLKEMSINTQKKPTKIPDSSFSIFYNFVNRKKLDLTSLVDLDNEKITFYKNQKVCFFGVNKNSTTCVNLRGSKAAEIFLVIMNLLSQIKENENSIETLKANKKIMPYNNEVISRNLEQEIKTKKILKTEFINMIKNLIKKYF